MACPRPLRKYWHGWKSGAHRAALPVQSALVQCCAERPQLLLPHVQNAEGRLREVLGRVLGEVATPSLGLDLLQFVGDDLDELRAATARAMSQSSSGLAPEVLNELAEDPVWFVRLRAIVSFGKLSDRRAIPPLLRGLTDSNRLVRLRAAQALVALKTEMVPVFGQVVEAQDRYGMYAYLTAIENANLRGSSRLNFKPAHESTKKRRRVYGISCWRARFRQKTCIIGESARERSGAPMIRFLDISNHALFWYYLASNLAYLTMLIVALKTSSAHQRRSKVIACAGSDKHR